MLFFYTVQNLKLTEDVIENTYVIDIVASLSLNGDNTFQSSSSLGYNEQIMIYGKLILIVQQTESAGS